MNRLVDSHVPLFRKILIFASLLCVWVATLLPQSAMAVPTFARQTGQNCVACHTGGQFPELTPYGRMFKLTGYTIGERTNPLSAMVVVSAASVADTTKGESTDPVTGNPYSTGNSNSQFSMNGQPVVATASLFVAGKISDRFGGFVQITHDPYASANTDGSYSGHTVADNIDIRYADRLISDNRDLVYGFSLNNNPSVSDPWNTAASWTQYVPVASPTSHQFTDGAAPYPGFGLDAGGGGGQVAGLTAYMFLNKTYYGEVGLYRTASNEFRALREGTDDAAITVLDGYAPYWRLAYNRELGAGNIMVGATGMFAKVYDGASDPTDSNSFHQVRTTGLDAQYQYILDPHTFTAQFAYFRQDINYSPNSVAAGNTSVDTLIDNVTPVPALSGSDTTNTARLKLAYTYMAKVGGSLSLFNVNGTSSANRISAGYSGGSQTGQVTGNVTGSPATSGITYEAFYVPIQNLRLGVQYTAYSQYNGSSSNYDGNGRNASDNNTVLLYAWLAF